MKKLTVVSLIAICCGAQTPAHFAVGSNVDQTDLNNVVWKSLPCPDGVTPYVVDSVGDKVLAQYRNLCYSLSSFNFEFLVQPSIYLVNLYFIDPNMTSSGARLFDIQVNDVYYRRAFDVFASAGQMKGIVVHQSIQTSDGKINVKVSMVRRNAILSGVELIDIRDTLSFPKLNAGWKVIYTKCIRCHGADLNKGAPNGLDLTTSVGILRGGSRGPAIIPGDADNSLIYKFASRWQWEEITTPTPPFRYVAPDSNEDSVSMPPYASLQPNELQALKDWINSGAKTD